MEELFGSHPRDSSVTEARQQGQTCVLLCSCGLQAKQDWWVTKDSSGFYKWSWRCQKKTSPTTAAKNLLLSAREGDSRLDFAFKVNALMTNSSAWFQAEFWILSSKSLKLLLSQLCCFQARAGGCPKVTEILGWRYIRDCCWAVWGVQSKWTGLRTVQPGLLKHGHALTPPGSHFRVSNCTSESTEWGFKGTKAIIPSDFRRVLNMRAAKIKALLEASKLLKPRFSCKPQVSISYWAISFSVCMWLVWVSIQTPF